MKSYLRIVLLISVLLISTCAFAQEDSTNPFDDTGIIVDSDNGITFTKPTSEVIAVESEEKEDESLKITTTSKMAANFLKSLKKLSDAIEKRNKNEDVWYWSNSNNKRTYDKQAQSSFKVTNCALFVVWGLAEMGIFQNDEKFYTEDNGEINWSGNTKKKLLKFCDMFEVNKTAEKLIKENELQQGDICCYDYQHTNVYAGDNMWFDASREGSINTQTGNKNYFKKIYSNVGVPDRKIHYIIRFNDGEKPVEKATTVVASKTQAKEDETTEEAKPATDRNSFTKNRQGFLNALEYISNRLAEDYKKGKPWYYSNEGTSSTFKKAVSSGKHKTNCAKYVVWAVAHIGVYDNGESFYAHKDCYIKWSSSKAKSKIEKYAKIINAHKKNVKTLMKDGTLKPGDICCYTGQHTNVYAGDGKWWDAGRRSDTTYVKNGTHYFKKLKSNTGTLGMNVNYIIRFKE